MIEQKIKRHRILVVDDTAENIDVLVTLLKPEYMIAAARSGEKALAMVAKNPPDLILLDIMMPGMDGYEACKRLKSDETTRLIPIIFVTAKSEAIDETMAFSLGAVDYITKPFVPAVIEARVKIHLALKDYQNHLEDMLNERTQQIEDAKTVAQAANMAKSEFIRNMSHELRTPLNGVLSASEIISDCDSAEKLFEIQNIIKASSQSLLQTVEGILAYAQAKDGELTLEQQPFRLDEALSTIKTTFLHKGSQVNLLLDYNFQSEDLPNALTGDGTRLVEVLNRLLENAAKFTQNTPKAQLTIKALKKSENDAILKFSIKDEGIGISHESFHEIFEPFFQVDTSQTRQFDGVGIGLATCRQMAELMNGTIHVESKPDQGSTFHLTASFIRQDVDIPFDSTILYSKKSKPKPAGPTLLPIDKTTMKPLLRTLYKALIEANPEAIRISGIDVRKYDIPGIGPIISSMEDYEYDEAVAALRNLAEQQGFALEDAQK